jgi:hypothetical protein
MDDDEARAHGKARRAWMEAQKNALGVMTARSNHFGQIVQELTCGCGQKRTVRVYLHFGDTPNPGQDDLSIVGADAIDRHNGTLQREAQNDSPGLETQDAVFNVVHSGLHEGKGCTDAKAGVASRRAIPLPAVAPISNGPIERLELLKRQVAEMIEFDLVPSSLRRFRFILDVVSVMGDADALACQVATEAETLPILQREDRLNHADALWEAHSRASDLLVSLTTGDEAVADLTRIEFMLQDEA